MLKLLEINFISSKKFSVGRKIIPYVTHYALHIYKSLITSEFLSKVNFIEIQNINISLICIYYRAKNKLTNISIIFYCQSVIFKFFYFIIFFILFHTYCIYSFKKQYYFKISKICKRKFTDKYSKEIASYFNISTNLRD